MTDDNLRDLAGQLPYDRPVAERTEGVRAALLAAAAVPAQPSPRRWLLVGGGFAAGALAAAAIAVLVLRSPSTTPVHEAYARIESTSAAAVEHTLSATPSGGTDEVVRVHGGTLRLAVPATRAGDRVRVVTADAEIEGAGGYEVVVAADALASVTVMSGSATVRVAKQAAMFLAAGQSWRATVQTADLTPVLGTTSSSGSPIETTVERSATPAPTSNGATVNPGPPATNRATATKPGSSTTNRATATTDGSPIEAELAPRPAVTAPPQITADAPPAPGSEIERHFRAGTALLRASKLADAVIELGAAADAGDTPLAADARYYQAVALVKAKRGAEAERALVQFLDHAPTSIRRGRAAMMLGRLLADRGDAKTARDWFTVAANDPDAAVAAAARAALAPR